MKKMVLIGLVLVGLVSSVFAGDIKYNQNYAASYAFKNYNQKTQVKFAKYLNNCTSFISQSMMAGFAKTTSMNTLYNKRKNFLADRFDTYSWFYLNKYDKGSTWSEAHSLYLYAKYTDKNDIGPNYLENGPKFKFVTYDTLTSYMDYNSVQVGDIIFMDWHDANFDFDTMINNGIITNEGKKHMKPDGHMDHTLIVTKINYWSERGYNKIRVASNSRDYKDRGLGDINEDYDKKALFYVYRPTNYISDK